MKAAWYDTACLAIIGLVFVAFARAIVTLFTDDVEVAAYAAHCLRIVAAGFPFYGFSMVMVAALNGAGDTRTPTLINVACMWMLELPLAWSLAHPAGFGPTGVFTAVAVAFTAMALVSTLVFQRGYWKVKRL